MIVAGCLLAMVVLVAGETLLRRAARRKIDGTPLGAAPSTVTLQAETMPDFLWIGRSWSMTIANRGDALHGCAVEVDEAECAIGDALDRGASFTLKWSHDTTNTDRCTRSGDETIVTKLPRRVVLRCRELDVDWSL